MTALKPGKRKGTARELAARLGVNERTIRSYIAQPREEYLSEAEQRRLRIRELREKGLSMRTIAAEIGCSVGTVHNALKDQPEDE
ncbi:helix-turn-helix domain-containing protein [Brevibacterium aurantiacum]|uniref:Transposase IS30-like HTH domain-containing protein n=1 Tax=Brevibacterium aurantiacum TaxID=273384 RepID=A0A2A3ZUH7_BREAU|nr:helix-turn-helix domain-containing protein [Brevibacterium aurantiacum]PCC41462.1 hypothetical protein CIK65_17560 [Brevibacterium aurantiacum]PCC55632.1 hypothetical protein CIK59_00055 [Brevibacterium aurantiacum]RCS98073.1 replication protein RepB [Brevibacterium aurantiacum]